MAKTLEKTTNTIIKLLILLAVIYTVITVGPPLWNSIVTIAGAYL